MGCDKPALEAGEGAKAPLSASHPWGPNGDSSEDKTNNGEILIISRASFTEGMTNSQLTQPTAPVKVGDRQRMSMASPGHAGLIAGSCVAGVDKGGCV